MIHASHRWVFVCELGVSTLFNRFSPPRLRDVFDTLLSQSAKGNLPIKSTGLATGKIEKIEITGDLVSILFRYTDPEIPEGIVEHSTTKALRTLNHLPGEIPAVSAHMLIDVSAKYDARAAYPCIVENVDWLSRSLMTECLNSACKEFLTTQMRKPGAKEDQEYSVRLRLRGHQSSTLEQILISGGVLQGIQLETASVRDDGFGEGKYPVVTKQQAEISIKGRATGLAALNWLRQKVSTAKSDGLVRAKVVIETEGRGKTQSLDLKLADVAENYLIKQVRVDGFVSPLMVCESEIRVDVIAKMKAVMPK